MRTIMIIGGSERQLALIEKCNSIGLHTIVIDGNKESVGKKYASTFYPINIYDVDSIVKIGKLYDVKAVISDQSDIAVPIVSRISNLMGLAGISEVSAIRFTNKYEMRKMCKQLGISQPAFVICKECSEAFQFANTNNFPIVVKPVDSSASRGVSIVRNISELEDKFSIALNASISKQVITESFIDGPEFTVEGYKFGDKHISVGISIKSHYKNSPMVANQLFYTPDSNIYNYEDLRMLNDRIIEGFGLEFGLTHSEYKYSNGEFLLIEVASRGGGGGIASDILPKLAGVDIYDMLIRNALREQSGNQLIIKCNYVCLQFFNAQNGKVKSVSNFDLIKNHPNVISASLLINAGDIIRTPQNDGERIGGFIVFANTEPELTRLVNYLDSCLEIEYE